MKKRITICIYIIFIAVISICCGLVRVRTKENNNPNSDSDNTIAESEVKKSKTGITFLLIFIGLLLLFGGLRVRVIYKRNKTLKKIRGK